MFWRILPIAPLMQVAAEAAAEPPFVWREHTWEIVRTALLSMVPVLEGRYAIFTTIDMGMPALFVYLLAFAFSSLPVPFILLLLRPVLDWFYTLPIKPVQKFAAWVEQRAQRKHAAMQEKNRKGLRGRFSAETAELLGLYLFVAIPLPGTGVWTGSAIATLFEMPRGKAAVVILLGNATACLITTLGKVGIQAFI